MDSQSKVLIKMLAFLESKTDQDLIICKPTYVNKPHPLYCFELLVTPKDRTEDRFVCHFFFECSSSMIYLEDYGSLFTNQSPVTEVNKKLFVETLVFLKNLLKRFPDITFRYIQTTSRIPEKFEFLKYCGFIQREQLNHYGNTKFLLDLKHQ